MNATRFGVLLPGAVPARGRLDSRGVRRTYNVALDDGVLRMWRDHPTFAQRYSATLGHDSFQGRWQVAHTPDDWQDDLEVTYRRRA